MSFNDLRQSLGGKPQIDGQDIARILDAIDEAFRGADGNLRGHFARELQGLEKRLTAAPGATPAIPPGTELPVIAPTGGGTGSLTGG